MLLLVVKTFTFLNSSSVVVTSPIVFLLIELEPSGTGAHLVESGSGALGSPRGTIMSNSITKPDSEAPALRL